MSHRDPSAQTLRGDNAVSIKNVRFRCVYMAEKRGEGKINMKNVYNLRILCIPSSRATVRTISRALLHVLLQSQ